MSQHPSPRQLAEITTSLIQQPHLLGIEYLEQQSFQRELLNLVSSHFDGGIVRFMELMKDDDTRQAVRGAMQRPNAYCYSIPFSFVDNADGDYGSAEGTLKVEPNGISFRFDGHSDSCSKDDKGQPVYIEQYEGELKVRIYGDLNRDEPTESICLSGARNGCRRLDLEDAS